MSDLPTSFFTSRQAVCLPLASNQESRHLICKRNRMYRTRNPPFRQSLNCDKIVTTAWPKLRNVLPLLLMNTATTVPSTVTYCPGCSLACVSRITVMLWPSREGEDQVHRSKVKSQQRRNGFTAVHPMCQWTGGCLLLFNVATLSGKNQRLYWSWSPKR